MNKLIVSSCSYFAGPGRETHVYIIIIKGVPEISWLNGDMFYYLFQSHMMSLFTCAVSVWSCASYTRYLCRIDKLQDRAVSFGYLKYTAPLIIHWNSLILDFRQTSILIREHPLACLRPPCWNRILSIRTSYPKLRASV